MAANNSDKFSKLPELAKPSLYEIKLAPCLKTFKFRGTEKIHLEITKPTNFLKLHSSALEIEKASLKLSDGTVLSGLSPEVDNKWTLLTVPLQKEVQPQKAELEFTFNGEMAGDMHGFYKSSYKDEKGVEQFLASTQFESTYARKAFPCWDEPTYKAQFDIQFEVDNALTILSNMPIAEEKKSSEGNNNKVVKFARTPLMSSYLVAFAVGNFEYIETKSKIGCDVRIYTVPGKKEQGEFALEVASKAIDYFSDWFGIKMPLPKCDLIALPDFAMGAMENWGLITFREHTLLYDPTKSSSAHKQRISLVVAHEVAHFWFGNLVTMKWWTDLWLKEGFASFMEYVFIGHAYPEFKIWTEFVNSEVVSGMKLDALRSSHPIEVPIDNPNELDEIYDSITYAKSNSIIRMLFNYLGEPTFQKGLRMYLQKHKYANATTEDLWKSLAEASGTDVNTMMSSWTQQMGFPLMVVEDKALDGNRRELALKQSRFLADGGQDEGNPVWQVPIGITTADNPRGPKTKYLLLKPEDKCVVEGVKPNEWIKLNSDFTSFFRVQYSQHMLKQLFDGVKNRELDVLDRFELANDLYALVSSTRVPASQFLEFLNVCQDEDDYFVWSSIDSGLADLDHVLAHVEDGGKLKERFHRFVCKVIEPVAAKYGWEPKEGEDMLVGRLRALLISRLARSQHQPTVQTALAKFADSVEKDVELVPDLRQSIYGTVGRTNDPKHMAALKHILETCNYAEIERCCIIGIGQCTDPKLAKQNFDYGVIEGKIRGQDLLYLFMSASVAPSAGCQHVCWDFFRNNMQLILEKYGGTVNNSLFQHCLKFATKSFCSSAMADAVEGFCKKSFDEHSLKTLDRPIRQIVESIKLNERLLTNNTVDLDEYLQKAGF